MTDELDPVLTRLFAEAREPLADGEFTAALNGRPVLETTAAAVRVVGELSPASTELFISPWGWAASMLIGAALLLRFRPSRR